ANSSEPWMLPDVDTLPTIDPNFTTAPNTSDGFMPYLRDENLARPWALPGTEGLEHRIGGLEEEDGSGNISYDPDNHEPMPELHAGQLALLVRGRVLVDAVAFTEVQGQPIFADGLAEAIEKELA